MPDGRDAVAIKVLQSLSEVSPEAWNACAGDANPFVRHEFLSALEDSGSATRETGWLGQHLVIEDASGAVAAFGFETGTRPSFFALLAFLACRRTGWPT